MTKTICLLAVSQLLCAVSFASTTLCPASPQDAVPVNSFPATNTPPFGCGRATTSFSNFAVTTGDANSGVAAPGPGDVVVFTDGLFPIDHIVFSTPGAGPTWVLPPGDATLDSVIAFTAQAGPSDTFTRLDVPMFIGPANLGGGILTITTSYCLGQTTLASCPAGHGGTIRSVQNGVDVNSATVRLEPIYDVIALQVDINSRNLTGQPFGLSALHVFLLEDQGPTAGASAGQTVPEPSVFTMIGTALVAAGLTRFGRKSS